MVREIGSFLKLKADLASASFERIDDEPSLLRVFHVLAGNPPETFVEPEKTETAVDPVMLLKEIDDAIDLLKLHGQFNAVPQMMRCRASISGLFSKKPTARRSSAEAAAMFAAMDARVAGILPLHVRLGNAPSLTDIFAD